MPERRILVVDDEDNLRTMLCAALRYEGYDVSQAADGQEGLKAARETRPDLIILDVMMPGLDGFAVCRRLRESGDRTPIIFLTARDSSKDKVEGLTIGADDYLQKPFNLDELVARVEAVSRRVDREPSAADVYRVDDLELDDVAHRVTRAGVDIQLSPTEYNLLKYLMQNTGRVLSRGQLLENVWGYSRDDDPGVVETYIGYVRRKVDANDPKLIQTIRGVGYTLRLP
ncbi:response regulator transcription factor [Demequina lignilytica]|uniref:Response regulator transcription factor n=1 Tax=Demequina lignilytica TaxID=3051663 RepID=A0AAW7M9C2_9MICO|nr:MULTISPECIES: response regulator transcription factor [unclassified Demequina]MDN4477958.1 response regulator transcription factor [Demequina sp. SYSU T00039-1]MDN4484263.1 response regulator transcription factor [Demequina sp. SYSU T0a273]MDN4487867.1 response regulator transcription factor [Demequina sp. SYSU T00039]MDN4490750.1 response regulator transcription factor [Demequina sp. SYSU T00068]